MLLDNLDFAVGVVMSAAAIRGLSRSGREPHPASRPGIFCLTPRVGTSSSPEAPMFTAGRTFEPQPTERNRTPAGARTSRPSSA
jgi:hypothetical protein